MTRRCKSCKDDQVFIGDVQYIDFQKNDSQSDEDNLVHSVIRKRESLERERELRVIIQRVHDLRMGLFAHRPILEAILEPMSAGCDQSQCDEDPPFEEVRGLI